MEILIGFSPCPNDTFIFDALVNKRIETLGLTFKPILADVEELNNMAIKNKISITKLSYFTFLQLTDKYIMSNSGGALGNGVGPLLISKKNAADLNNEILNGKKIKVAIPGKNTTANFLLTHAFPNIKEKVEIFFSDIEAAVLDEKVDAGVIIHENRFTYEQKGLQKIKDLGAHWEEQTQAPIPLGGIAISRSIKTEIQQTISLLINQSIKFAFNNSQASKEYIKKHAQELDDTVIQKHIDLYVNDFSLDLGPIGKKAVALMAQKAQEMQLIPKITQPLFVF